MTKPNKEELARLMREGRAALDRAAECRVNAERDKLHWLGEERVANQQALECLRGLCALDEKGNGDDTNG